MVPDKARLMASADAAAKSSLGLFEFRTMLTGHVDDISKHMIASAHAYSGNEQAEALSFNQFRIFLDLNPYLRTMFLEALNPQMWAIDPTGIPLPKQLFNKGTILEVAVDT